MEKVTRNTAIRALIRRGETYAAVADIFGISRQRVDQIVNDEKERARQATKAALAVGDLNLPDRCEGCGRGGALEAHHHDYSDPMDVSFLCLECHRAEHASHGPDRHGAYQQVGPIPVGEPTDTIAQRISVRRRQLRMTNIELAEAVGTKAPHVSNWQNGHVRPSARSIAKLASALCVSCDWLLTGHTRLPSSDTSITEAAS